MAKARTGKKVKIHYTCKLNDGTVVESSRRREPVELMLGQGQLLPGLEEAVEAMEPGQSETVIVPADQAHGPRRDELIREIPLSQFPDQAKPQVGQEIECERSNGERTTVSVAAVSESSVTIDGNHPLAGKDLVFELELFEVA
jgi:peptidylprolyl isomerase